MRKTVLVLLVLTVIASGCVSNSPNAQHSEISYKEYDFTFHINGTQNIGAVCEEAECKIENVLWRSTDSSIADTKITFDEVVENQGFKFCTVINGTKYQSEELEVDEVYEDIGDEEIELIELRSLSEEINLKIVNGSKKFVEIERD